MCDRTDAEWDHRAALQHHATDGTGQAAARQAGVLPLRLSWTPPVSDHTSVPEPLADRPQWLGSYRVLDVLGEGGMGTVYLAEQQAPVRRTVAVKVVKLGMDSRAVLVRFEAERRALERMEHEHISKVLDAGLLADGRPFFAMEYVPGPTLTEHCRRQESSLRERLELFVRVCQGVQHAHQKGILHRDLKPANVLVATQDGRAVPKIIDFGLARAIERDHGVTRFTGRDELLGTPAYMSPEQCDRQGHDVDARTDIWALGLLLYELLVGDLPIARVDLARIGFDELVRRIRDVEPQRPSVRLAAAIAHGAAPPGHQAAWLPALRGDLDWIVMRAIAKEPARRYQTALALADDIGRNLRFEPVEARPPTLVYRVSRFVRRYRLVVAAAATVLVSVLVGAAICVWLLLETQAARRMAERASEDSRLRLALAQMAAIDRAAWWTSQSFDQARAPTLAEVEAMRVEGQPVLTGMPSPPADPWGAAYALAPARAPGDWVVRSPGPDGRFGTADDLEVHDPLFARGVESRWRSLFEAAANRMLDVVQESAVLGQMDGLMRIGLQAPRDPWGHAIEPRVEAEHWLVRSDGPDGRSGTADDLELRRPALPVFVEPSQVRAQVGLAARVWTRLPIANGSAAGVQALLRPLLANREGALEQLRFGAFDDQLALVGPPELLAFVVDNLRLLAPDRQQR